MRLVLNVLDRPTGSVVTALELGTALTRAGHEVLHDDGDYDQAWDGADAALFHADRPVRAIALSRRHRVPLVLLARTDTELAALDTRTISLAVKPTLAGFNVSWPGRELAVPPLAPAAYWAVCPTGDVDCGCPTTAVCRYEADPQLGRPADDPRWRLQTVTAIGAASRHRVGLVYEIARRLPQQPFVVVRTAGSLDPPTPPLGNLAVVGPYEPAELRRIYANTRILLMAGAQTAGRPALEAGASSIPTIAAPSPGAHEVLGGHVMWISPERPADWVRAIEQLDVEPLRRRWADLAYHRATADRRGPIAELEKRLQHL